MENKILIKTYSKIVFKTILPPLPHHPPAGFDVIVHGCHHCNARGGGGESDLVFGCVREKQRDEWVKYHRIKTFEKVLLQKKF